MIPYDAILKCEGQISLPDVWFFLVYCGMVALQSVIYKDNTSVPSSIR